jgi:hypothetical protein
MLAAARNAFVPAARLTGQTVCRNGMSQEKQLMFRLFQAVERCTFPHRESLAANANGAAAG